MSEICNISSILIKDSVERVGKKADVSTRVDTVSTYHIAGFYFISETIWETTFNSDKTFQINMLSKFNTAGLHALSWLGEKAKGKRT